MKTCTQCRLTKPLLEFYISKTGKDGYRGNCKDCTKKIVSSKISSSRKLHNETRNTRRYGLTPEQHSKMLADQEGVCYICKSPPTGRALHIDHDHKCCPRKTSCGNCVRKLLCHNCNVVLGLLHEDVDILRAMINYIEL